MRYLLTSSLVSPTFKAETETGSEDNGKVIDKVVYLKPDDTLKDIVLHVSNVADATMRLVAAMTVHAIVRTYSPVIADRAKWNDVQEEIMVTIKEHAAMKRGYDFKRAWTYRLLQTAKRMCQSLMTDYDKKGVQDGSPLQHVLRSKSVDKACETVVEFMTAKTKGATSFAALEKSLNPPVPITRAGNAPAKGKRGATGKGGNAAKASTVASAITGAKATEAFNAVEAKNPVQRAIKIADKIGAANVDHFTMVKRFIGLMDDPAKLMEIADIATERAKAVAAKAEKPHKRHKTSEGGTPPAVAAAQA